MINRLPKGYAVNVPATGRQPAVALPLAPTDLRKSLPNRLLDAAANSVGAYPVVSLGVAFATGILLGKLVKR